MTTLDPDMPHMLYSNSEVWEPVSCKPCTHELETYLTNLTPWDYTYTLTSAYFPLRTDLSWRQSVLLGTMLVYS